MIDFYSTIFIQYKEISYIFITLLLKKCCVVKDINLFLHVRECYTKFHR